MAGVLIRCAVFSPPPRFATAAASPSQPSPPQPPLAAAPRKPLRLAKRRNHLRPKILKTLPKPYAPVRTPEELPSDAAGVPAPSSETLTDLFEAEPPAEEAPQVTESVAIGPEHGGVAGKLSAKSVIKFGAYLVAVFLFQTICAVWVFGSNGSDSNGESEERISVNGEGRAVSGKKLLSRTRNVVYLDESDLERRIEEISSMAREARRSEKRGLKRDDAGDGEGDDGDDDDDGEAIPDSRMAIEKEIGSRLDKLQKKLRPVRKSPGLSENVPLEGASSLMFKKKLKFRSPLVEKPSTAPKGFQRLQDNGKTKKKSKNEVNGEGKNGGLDHGVTESSNGEKWEELVDGKGHGGLSDDIKQEGDETMVFTEMQNDLHSNGVGEGQSFPQEDEEVGDTRGRTGIVEEASGKRNSVGGANLRTTGNSSLKSSRSFGDEKQEATKRSAGRDIRSVNGTLKREEIKATSMSKRVEDKQSDKIEEFWWLKLPCVFVRSS